MHKNLVDIFGYVLQTHAVVSLIAIILAMGIGYGVLSRTKYQGHLSNFMIWLLIGAIVGARFWHVFIFQWPTYSTHPGMIIQIWAGGISILGAIVGGSVALYLYCRRYKLDFLDLSDFLSVPMIAGMGLGRIACFSAGDAFGTPTGTTYGMIFPKDTLAYQTFGDQPLWPAISWEIQGDFVIFAILFFLLHKKLSRGIIFALFYLLYGALRFTLGFVRGDSPKLYLGMNGGQWTCMAFMLFGLVLGLVVLTRQGLFKKTNAVEEAQSE